MKKYIILFIITVILLTVTGCGEANDVVYNLGEVESIDETTPTDTSVSERSGLDSPEEAVRAYLEGLRDSDLDRMIEALAGVDALDYGICAEESINSFINVLNVLIDEFQVPVAPYEFQSLEILGFVPPEFLDERYASEMNLTNISNKAERLGVDQLVSRVVVFELGGEKHILMVDVVDFGGEWRISEFGGNIGGLLFVSPFLQGLIPSEFVDEFIGDFEFKN